MTTHELFTEVTRGGWVTIGKDVQMKLRNGVLSFQCSSGKSDWKHNFKAWRKVYDKSDVPFVAHAGFTELWLSIKPVVEAIEFDVVLGYSQGADIAMFVHENYFHRKGYECETFLFAPSPMIFMPSALLRSRFSRVRIFINPGDIVYYAALILGYRHIGKTIKLPRVKVSKKNTWKEKLLDLSNHTPERYELATKEYGS
jgi:hypothetical protein